MSTDYRYTVRNVAQKEIYDSYMGILRISPNKDQNGKMIDDPTNFLNTIGCKDIQLSSSNGDPLPVHFVPYTFSTQNVLTISNGNILRETKDIINVCTDTTLTNYASGNIYVANEFIARSTLQLIDSSETSKKKSKIAIAYGCSNTDDNEKADCEGILLYPIESPNDSTYFNNKNTLKLFQSDNPKPRTEQVEESLLKKSLQWYNTTLNDSIYCVTDSNINPTNAGKNIQSHRVIANNQFVNQFNDDNEEVPVLYTRDYILGHYEGHSQKTNKDNRNALKTHYLPSDSQIYEAEETDNVTKLSWIRFDNLVWDCLDEVLSGKIRHVNGRYDNLGTGLNSEGNSIFDKLFGPEKIEGVNQHSNLYPNEVAAQFLDYTAPLVGKGVQEGMIMYHAMPFHRYWFHRCRQVLFNMNEFKKQYELTYNGDATKVWGDINQSERSQLESFNNKELITPCCKASITPHHSLVKDFLLCNGQSVNLTNFPNISLNNNNLLKDGDNSDLLKGKQATPSENTKFNQKTDWDKSSTYYALHESSNEGNYIKLPNLFNFQEKYPRFIRGLNWIADTNNIQNFSNANNENNNDKNLKNNTNRISYLNNDSVNKKLNIWDEYGKCFEKNFTTVDKPYYFSFDYLTPKHRHRHLLFANKNGKTKQSTSYLNLVTYDKDTPTGIGINPDNVKYLPIMHNLHQKYIENYNKLNATIKNNLNSEWANWYNYNFFNQEYYKKFKPVHTAGLYIFNKDFPHRLKDSSDDKDWSITEGWIYYDVNGDSHSLNVAPITSTAKDISQNNLIDFENMDQYRSERNRRRQLIIKLNESEGITPISIEGGPSFFHTTQRQSWQRKRTSVFKKRWDWEVGTLFKQNVATYKLYGGNFKYSDSPNAIDDGTYHWRSLTSLQYWNCEKLAVGNLKDFSGEKYLKRDSIPLLANDYYNYHNVTDVWRDSSASKSEELKYGSTTVKVDTTSPYPSFLNLIPLIRL